MNPRTCAVLAGLGLLGCSSGTGPNGAVALSLGTLSSVTAGDSLPVSVHALTTNNVTLRLIVVRITGVFTVIDSVSLHAVGETLFVHSYLVPPQTPPGAVTVKVTARGGFAADSQEAVVTILPHAYTSISFPSLGGVLLIPLPVEPTLTPIDRTDARNRRPSGRAQSPSRRFSARIKNQPTSISVLVRRVSLFPVP